VWVEPEDEGLAGGTDRRRPSRGVGEVTSTVEQSPVHVRERELAARARDRAGSTHGRVDRLVREIGKHALPEDVRASPRLQPGGAHDRAEILAIEVDGDKADVSRQLAEELGDDAAFDRLGGGMVDFEDRDLARAGEPVGSDAPCRVRARSHSELLDCAAQSERDSTVPGGFACPIPSPTGLA